MTQPDIIPKSFKVELKPELPYWLIILPCIFLLGILSKPGFISSWALMLLLAFILITYSALTYRLNLIEIDTIKGEVTLTETNLLKSKRAKKYPLREIQFTYKKGKTGLYHRVVNICRLYQSDKEIAAVIPDQDGWTDETVNDLAKGLVTFGVPKKFLGYNFKDAQINCL